jgi:hypothetical protein
VRICAIDLYNSQNFVSRYWTTNLPSSKTICFQNSRVMSQVFIQWRSLYVHNLKIIHFPFVLTAYRYDIPSVKIVKAVVYSIEGCGVSPEIDVPLRVSLSKSILR